MVKRGRGIMSEVLAHAICAILLATLCGGMYAGGPNGRTPICPLQSNLMAMGSI